MKFNQAQVLPLIMKMGEFLKAGMDHYADLRVAGQSAGPEMIAAFISVKMADWNPKIGQIELLDNPTKDACARFLAGVACKVAAA